MGPSGCRQFAVLDFGLAVRSGGWKHEWKAGKVSGYNAHINMVYMPVFIYTYVYRCMCMCMSMCAYIYIHMHIIIYIDVYVDVYVYVYICG